jgi:hypothetical protein
MLPAVLDTSSTAYQVGQLIGIATVVIIAFVVVRRARSRATAVLAVVVASGILTADAISFAGRDSAGAWSSHDGVAMKAGFIDGCRNNAPEPVCKCIFTHIASQPAYDTPEEFATLRYGVERYSQTGDTNAIPRVFYDAGRSCVS